MNTYIVKALLKKNYVKASSLFIGVDEADEAVIVSETEKAVS